MKSKKVSMEDIAREIGVSKNAVSLALRGRDGVSEELRQKIITKAREMHYGQMDAASQQCILALVPQRFMNLLDGMFYQQVCFHMESYARSKGYLLTICSVSEEEEKACRVHPMLGQMAFQGIATVGNLSRDYCALYRSCGVKYVMVDQYYNDIPVDSFTTANMAATYQLTQHLIECGHRNIQFFGSRNRTSSLYDRWRGYQKAMADYGLREWTNVLTEAVRHAEMDEYSTVRQALENMEEFPTAFVCGHDVTAKQIIDILALRGMHCPEDFSVVGFDDIQNPELTPLNLTTYRTPKSEIARASIDCLISGSSRPPQKVELYGEMIKRGSVKTVGEGM